MLTLWFLLKCFYIYYNLYTFVSFNFYTYYQMIKNRFFIFYFVHDFWMFSIVFDHANACTSMPWLVKIHNRQVCQRPKNVIMQILSLNHSCFSLSSSDINANLMYDLTKYTLIKHYICHCIFSQYFFFLWRNCIFVNLIIKKNFWTWVQLCYRGLVTRLNYLFEWWLRGTLKGTAQCSILSQKAAEQNKR